MKLRITGYRRHEMQFSNQDLTTNLFHCAIITNSYLIELKTNPFRHQRAYDDNTCTSAFFGVYPSLERNRSYRRCGIGGNGPCNDVKCFCVFYERKSTPMHLQAYGGVCGINTCHQQTYCL